VDGALSFSHFFPSLSLSLLCSAVEYWRNSGKCSEKHRDIFSSNKVSRDIRVYRSVWPSKRKKTARPENFSRWRGKRLPSTSFVTYWNGEKRRLDTPSCVAIHRDGRFLHSHYKTHTHKTRRTQEEEEEDPLNRDWFQPKEPDTDGSADLSMSQPPARSSSSSTTATKKKKK
jgi:hypothetical protein